MNGRPAFDFLDWVLFWAGAVAVMAIAAWLLFREQYHEWVTLRRLGRRIGPFFEEFDPPALRRWVELAAPHLWAGWRKRDLGSMKSFATREFLEREQARFAEEARGGLVHDARLGRVLKVHPLELAMAGAGPPPADVELLLRIEVRAVDCLRGPDGQVVEGRPDERQLMYFWTLRHDGRQWRLHAVEPATRDRTDLGKRPAPPPVAEWKRPAPPGDDGEKPGESA